MSHATTRSQAQNNQQRLNVLVSGAGIAGITVAFYLARLGHRCTIIERARALRASGQSIDLRGHGITVLQRMGAEVEADVRSKTSKEAGFRAVDAQDNVLAEFPVDDGRGFTAEIEVMRGELAISLFEAAEKLDGVETVFGKSITSLNDRGSAVEVKVSGGWPGTSDADEAKTFDIVIAADGWASSTRAIAFDQAAFAAIKPLGQWGCWCTVPWQPSDGTWARWYNATRGRMIMIRPDNEQFTRASMWTMTRDPKIAERMPQLAKAPTSEQQEFFKDLFADAGWEADRLVQGFNDTDDFYVQQIGQVYMDTWAKGRVVLVGDAGYCPSPISGMGATVAIVGAYVLAGELAKNPSDPPTAFKAYEERLRPFVKRAQNIFPGAPGVANPETEWGIWFLNCFLAFISWTRVYKLFGASFNPPASALDLPDYKI